MPRGSKLYLYGSRARGNAREDSDWDLLLLLDKPHKESTDFEKYAYPIMEQGLDLWQYFSVHTYTKDEWINGPHSMFYFNVEKDKQLIYEKLSITLLNTNNKYVEPLKTRMPMG